MGHRLHVAKKYDIEYATPSNFNHEVEEFHGLLYSLDIAYSGDTYDDSFEILRSELQRGIEKLKNTETLEQEEQDSINEALDNLRETKDEVIRYLEIFLEHSDKTGDYILLSFF